MIRKHFAGIAITGVTLAGALAYLYDPPWIGRVTSGLRDWERNPAGTRYRWTNGHAAFFVPSETTAITVPLRAGFPSPDGRPVRIDLSVDDRWLARLELTDPAVWTRPTFPLPRRRGWRKYRRVDVRVSRTLASFNLGVQIGEIELH
jgi:hypothetical protein